MSTSRRRPPGDRRPAGERRPSGGGRPADGRPADGQPARGRHRISAEPPPRRSELWQRVLVAVPAAVLAIVFVDLGGWPWTLLMIAFGGACMHELYRLLERWRPLPAVGFALLIGLALAAHLSGRGTVLEVAMASIPLLFVAVLVRGRHTGSTVAIAGTLLGVMWIGMAFAHGVLLRQLPHGGGVTIDVLVGTFLGDTAAYLGGKVFGRRPLAPTISPHKTTEGLYVGMLVALVAVFVAGLFQPWLSQGEALELGAAVAVLGPLGDLFESVVKREAGSKDAGTLFGAHGGALDRLDAVMFTIVAGYYIWSAVAG